MMFQGRFFTTTDLHEVCKVMIFKVILLARPSWNSVSIDLRLTLIQCLVFKYPKCLSIFIKKHLFLGCVANWSRFWTGAMCGIDSLLPSGGFLASAIRQAAGTLESFHLESPNFWLFFYAFWTHCGEISGKLICQGGGGGLLQSFFKQEVMKY